MTSSGGFPQNSLRQSAWPSRTWAARLGLHAGDSATDAAAVALEHLRRGACRPVAADLRQRRGSRRTWGRSCRRTRPRSSDVAQITRWTHYASRLSWMSSPRTKASAISCAHVPGLAAGDAARIAAAAGDLPLVIAQAAAWLSETGMALPCTSSRLETHAVSALGLASPSVTRRQW